jgi:hypothetical protein
MYTRYPACITCERNACFLADVYPAIHDLLQCGSRASKLTLTKQRQAQHAGLELSYAMGTYMLYSTEGKRRLPADATVMHGRRCDGEVCVLL